MNATNLPRPTVSSRAIAGRSDVSVLAAFALLLITLPGALGQHSLNYTVFGRLGNGSPFSFGSMSYALGSTFLSPAVPINLASGDLRANVNGAVNYGLMFAEASLISSGKGNGAANANFSSTDRVTISSAGVVGTVVAFTARLHLTGGGYAEEPAAWGSTRHLESRYNFLVTSGTNVLVAQRTGAWISTDGGGRVESAVDEYIDLTVSGIFGTPNPLTLSLNLSVTEFGNAAGGTLPTGSAGADFAHTVVWLGITEVRDAQGNLITDYTATSSAGVDWSKSNPALPALQIELQPDGMARISWPVSAGPLVLRSTDTLSQPHTWTTDPSALTTNGPTKFVTIPITQAAARFYTLGAP